MQRLVRSSCSFSHASEASETSYDLIVSVFHDLVRKLVVSEERLSAISTTSAFPEAMISSIIAGSLSAPIVATGFDTCFFISAAR